MNRREQGFTLVEVGVVVPIIMVLALVLFSMMFNYLMASDREQVRLSQAYTQSMALDRLESDIRIASSYLETTDPTVSDPNAAFSNNGVSPWSYSGQDSTHRVLILREFSTGNNPLSSVRTPVYTMTPSAPDCSRAIYLNGPLQYDIVYFVSGTTLYKRILTDQTDRTCSPPYQKQTCPEPTTSGDGTRSTTGCSANDEVVAQNVSAFSVDYYATQGSGSPLPAYSTPADVETAKSVDITITNSQRSYNGTVSTSSSLRTTTLNQVTGGK